MPSLWSLSSFLRPPFHRRWPCERSRPPAALRLRSAAAAAASAGAVQMAAAPARDYREVLFGQPAGCASAVPIASFVPPRHTSPSCPAQAKRCLIRTGALCSSRHLWHSLLAFRATSLCFGFSSRMPRRRRSAEGRLSAACVPGAQRQPRRPLARCGTARRGAAPPSTLDPRPVQL